MGATTTIRSAIPIGYVGRFEILGRLAQGGMAEILLAREKMPGGTYRHLVLKRILSHVAHEPEMREMFLTEARLAMRLSHPNICTIHELGQDGDRLYFAMEWVRGVSLASWIDRAATRGELLPVAVVARIFAQVADALHYAHTAKDDDGNPLHIVHRDVSPENVMISFDGHVKLLDFGIAKATVEQRKTKANVLKGKFAYMAPEQYTGEALDARVDIFALGVCLWEALTGERLFERGSEYETVAAILLEESSRSPKHRRPDVPGAIDVIVQRCLRREPDARPPSAAAVQVVLEGWLTETKQRVPASQIAALVQAAFAAEIKRGPQVDTRGVLVTQVTHGTPTQAGPVEITERLAIAADVDDIAEDMARARRRRLGLILALCAIVVLGLGATILRQLLVH